jgi:hypothetical protein
MASHGPSYRVVEAVAQKEAVSPSELSPPLFNVVDPEALDALVQPDADSNTDQVEVTFTYLDYAVRVQNGPELSISVQDRNASMDGPEAVPE